MLELLQHEPGELLALDRYRQDFQHHFWKTDVSWKLERQPTFKEPDSPSWVAMAEGDWDRSMRLAEGLRPARGELQAKLDEHGIVQRRVRFVTNPVTPYLQWELHLLKIWSEVGEQITILPVDHVDDLERGDPLPEVLVLGTEGAADRSCTKSCTRTASSRAAGGSSTRNSSHRAGRRSAHSGMKANRSRPTSRGKSPISPRRSERRADAADYGRRPAVPPAPGADVGGAWREPASASGWFGSILEVEDEEAGAEERA